jgi:hypothetical protein
VLQTLLVAPVLTLFEGWLNDMVVRSIKKEAQTKIAAFSLLVRGKDEKQPPASGNPYPLNLILLEL